MRKLIPIIIGFLAIGILISSSLYNKLVINLWSLDYKYTTHSDDLHFTGFPPADIHPRSIYWQAIEALNTGDPQTAIILLDSLNTPGDAYASQISAIAYESLGNYQAALDIWSHTANVEAIERIAVEASQAGELETAYAAYFALWNLQPVHGTIPLAKFLNNELNDPEAAESIYRQSLEIIKNARVRPYIMNLYAELLEDQGRWEEAATMYRNVINEAHLFYPEEENLPKRYAALARVYYQDGKYPQAVLAIDQSINLSSESPDPAYLQLAGQIYEAVGDSSGALAYYRHLLVLQPNNGFAREAIQRLGSE